MKSSTQPANKSLYPPDWYSIAQSVKEKANWQCQNCHHAHSPDTHFTLTVHHKDHNTFNNDELNLIALCQRCHLIEEGKYRSSLRIERLLNSIQASGQQIFPGFQNILFPKSNNPHLCISAIKTEPGT